ncbi:hypothetical protein D3C84_1203600 [compost metagenome]
MIDGRVDHFQGGCIERCCGVARRVPSGKKDFVAVIQRRSKGRKYGVQSTGARLGAAGFNATEVALRNPGHECKIELA